jgi:hypothetical protein
LPSFWPSIVGGTGCVIALGAEGFKSAVAKDAQPSAELAEINPEEVSAVFWGVARSNSQDGGQTLVDTPIKRFLAASFDFLALLSR